MNPNFDYKKIFNIQGRVIVIMGGAGKMGQAFAEFLSNAGGVIYITDINQSHVEDVAEKIDKKSQGSVHGIKCDVSKESDIQNCFEQILSKEGKLHGLIYNVYAKPDGYYKAFSKYPKSTWDKVMDINVCGAYLCCKEAVNAFSKFGIEGSIVLTLSTYGLVSPDFKIYEGLEASHNIYGNDDALTTPMPYTVSKSGLLGMIKWLAVSQGDKKIRVNGLSPGGVFDGQEKKFHEAYKERTPLGRMANWRDYNGAILFLMSDASLYMTGSNLVVDGGWTAH
jgi:NAD(P)-dependent dehydrogenase (short-subunit alcohol dehydrogenase family)